MERRIFLKTVAAASGSVFLGSWSTDADDPECPIKINNLREDDMIGIFGDGMKEYFVGRASDLLRKPIEVPPNKPLMIRVRNGGKILPFETIVEADSEGSVETTMVRIKDWIAL